MPEKKKSISNNKSGVKAAIALFTKNAADANSKI